MFIVQTKELKDISEGSWRLRPVKRGVDLVISGLTVLHIYRGSPENFDPRTQTRYSHCCQAMLVNPRSIWKPKFVGSTICDYPPMYFRNINQYTQKILKKEMLKPQTEEKYPPKIFPKNNINLIDRTPPKKKRFKKKGNHPNSTKTNLQQL